MTVLSGCISAAPTHPRAGFGLSDSANASYWSRALGASWYYTWGMNDFGGGGERQFWPMVRSADMQLPETRQKIVETAKKHPGAVWILGNEPDNIHQDNLSAEAYAEMFHTAAGWIQSADPGAQLAIAGMSIPSPLRLKYLETVLQTYRERFGEPMPVDWWNIHGYVLREERNQWGVGIPTGMDEDAGVLYEVKDHGDIEVFKQQVQLFRTWMKQHGYQDSSLVLSEFGILFPSKLGYSPDFVAQYLTDTFTWLDQARDFEIGNPQDEYRLVQRWAWFSLSDPIFPEGNLADLRRNRLTLNGESFRDYSFSSARLREASPTEPVSQGNR